MCYGELISASMQKARKLHQCTFCSKTIYPGTEYRKEVGKFEGDFYSIKEHKRCHYLQAALWAEHGNDMCYIDPRDAAHTEAHENGWRKLLAMARKAKEKFV